MTHRLDFRLLKAASECDTNVLSEVIADGAADPRAVITIRVAYNVGKHIHSRESLDRPTRTKHAEQINQQRFVLCRVGIVRRRIELFF